MHEELESMVKKYSPVLPDFPKKWVITYFAGVRAATYTEDFVIKESAVHGVVHAAGIQSPGLTAAPKIAEMVVDILRDQGLPLQEKLPFFLNRDVYSLTRGLLMGDPFST